MTVDGVSLFRRQLAVGQAGRHNGAKGRQREFGRQLERGRGLRRGFRQAGRRRGRGVVEGPRAPIRPSTAGVAGAVRRVEDLRGVVRPAHLRLSGKGRPRAAAPAPARRMFFPPMRRTRRRGL